MITASCNIKCIARFKQKKTKFYENDLKKAVESFFFALTQQIFIFNRSANPRFY